MHVSFGNNTLRRCFSKGERPPQCSLRDMWIGKVLSISCGTADDVQEVGQIEPKRVKSPRHQRVAVAQRLEAVF